MNEQLYKHVTSVKETIKILGGMDAFLQLPRKPLKYKTVLNWVTKNKFPANMTWLIESTLNKRGYAPVFEILTQDPIDVSEEMELIEQLAKRSHV